MSNTKRTTKRTTTPAALKNGNPRATGHSYHLEFLNAAQESAWDAFQKNDVLFMLGSAGTGKTLLATGFAIRSILQHEREKLIITRPVVEAGESLGYLPGDLHEKISPYMMPIYDSIAKICGKHSRDFEIVNASLEVCPLAYMRGRDFSNSIFVLDEAQNCTHEQLVLAITRLGIGSKMIITGDPQQSDLPGRVALEEIVAKLDSVTGVGVVRFTEEHIVRHPVIARILKKL